MKVAEALIRDNVRKGLLFFRTTLPKTNDLTRIELFRLRVQTLRQRHTIYGDATGMVLQRKTNNTWTDVASEIPIDWLFNDVELVEPTKELP